MNVMQQLAEIRSHTGPPHTQGLPDDVIARFAQQDPGLCLAVQAALERHRALRQTDAELLKLAETDLIARLQGGLVNFYQPETINPYVALAAKGPWVVSSYGAVVHDNGGYGMLGLGHNPDAVMAALGRDQVMANVMTPSFSQAAFDQRMRRELGHTRRDGCPFFRFICLNSGSESVTVAARLADINARRITAAGARHEGRTVKALAIQGGFHGRTGRPARISDSCRKVYEQHLATFRDHSDLVTVEQNNCQQLRDIFSRAEAQGVFFEAIYMEPVQGEGAPGRAMSREFYDLAAELIHDQGGILVVDSIQAGLRTHGVLSIVDYPGFQDAVAPDVETWSKALNAGQFPFSVLGLSKRAADLYVRGVYGNTMTTNPRALDVAVTVLDGLDDELRANIVRQGAHFLQQLRELQRAYPDVITRVEGTGLLFCAELAQTIPVVGFDSPEERCRRAGLGIIHGGVNAIRFTPHFGITDDEVLLVVDVLRQVVASLSADLAA
ncbi:MAG: aminotransferase class III-fold pyridoxal phosphate-dependent enzyme [Oligoflexia bacterium]|nr:aminotransferase class III-fold pyridoxal phosphate-dependent enzyme [Oligoflexia bacterium]